MTDSRTIALMYLVVDGEATPEEGTELRKVLGESAEARADFAEIEELARQLEAAGADERYPRISEAVIAELRRRADNVHPFRFPAAGREAGRSGSPFRTQRRRWLTAAWAAAALAVVSIAVIPVLTSRMAPIDRSSAAGSLRPIDTRSWPEVGRFQASGSETVLVVRRQGRRIAIAPRLEAKGDEQARLRWDGERLAFLEFSPEVRQNAAHNNNGEVTFGGGDVSPLLVLEIRGGERDSVPVVLSIGGRDVVTAWISMD